MVFAVVFIDMYLGGGGADDSRSGQTAHCSWFGTPDWELFCFSLIESCFSKKLAVQLTFYQVKEMIL